MPDSTSVMRPLNLELFRPALAAQSNAYRVRRLVEGRLLLSKNYGTAYGGIADTLETVRAGSHPSLAGMTAEQRQELEDQLVACRDQVARGFTQAIARAENDANELAPGTFPRGDQPFQSFDLGEWFEQVLEGLIDILRGLAGIFDAFGFDMGADAMSAAADGLDRLDEYGEEQGWWSEGDD